MGGAGIDTWEFNQVKNKGGRKMRIQRGFKEEMRRIFCQLSSICHTRRGEERRHCEEGLA